MTDDGFTRRPGCSLPLCPTCRMKAPERDGACVICDLLGLKPKLPRGARGGGEPERVQRKRRKAA